MVVLGWLFYRGARPRLRIWLGLAAGFAGAALLIRPPSGEPAESSFAGAVALALAPLCWSLGSLHTRATRPTDDTLLISAMQMLAGGVLMLGMGTLLGEWPLLATRPVSPVSLAAFAYLTVVGGLVGFTTYAWLLRHASPPAVSTHAYVNPLVAVLLGWLVAGETLDARVLAAAGLVLGAVVLITLRSYPGPGASTSAGAGGAAARPPVAAGPPSDAAPRRGSAVAAPCSAGGFARPGPPAGR
jgi:drug/metabolite transporter (DMT)-like permease